MTAEPSIAAFVVSDEPYCPKAIMSLLSLRHHNPNYDCFIAGSIRSDVNLKLLKRFKISLIQVDYSHIFRQPEGTWPSEVWWLPLIPRHLYHMGYDVSLGVDGDVYVVKPFILNVVQFLLTNQYHIAGIANGPISRYITLDKWPADFSKYISRSYNIDRDASNSIQCTNSGVLWFNNKLLHQNNFHDRWIEAYTDITSTWRKYSCASIFKGDQEGFAMLIPSIRFLYISPFYNFRFHNDIAIKAAQGSRETLRERLMAVHFVHSKPWYRYSEEDICRYSADIGKGVIRLMYIKKWQSVARRVYGEQANALRVLEFDKTHWGVRQQWLMAKKARAL